MLMCKVPKGKHHVCVWLTDVRGKELETVLDLGPQKRAASEM